MQAHYYVSACVFAAMVAALVWVNNDQAAPVLVLVFAFGAVGAILRDHVHQRAASKEGPASPSAAAWFSPVIGALVALVLMALFLSGLVSGDLFPKFLKTEQPFETARGALRNGVVLASQADFYKMIAWSILAGYSQRYVLAKLEALTSTASSGSKAKARSSDA
jgi:hypothetical protein